jgi:hypothetical protein
VTRRARVLPARRSHARAAAPPLRRSAAAPLGRWTPTLRRSANALSAALLAHGVLGLKVAAAALAVATVALVNQQLSQRTQTELEFGRNETVVYRQAASRPVYVEAEVSDTLTDPDEEAVSYYPRAVRTVRFLNPDAKEPDRTAIAAPDDPTRLAALALLTPQSMVRVGGFVAFPATKQSDAVASLSASPRKRNGGFLDEVDDYLWDVYQRMPIKRDSSGDFSWKDPAAAQRAGMSLQDYVIGGMDANFREQLYHAGRAMDAAGVHWSMLSAFRDDYRQRLAAGFKASIGNSLHGGSRRTGGYGHGRAIDITNAEGNAEVVWEWIDKHGAQYGLHRPMPGADPAHIQQTGDSHKISVALHHNRGKGASKLRRRHAAGGKIKVAAARASR